MGAKHTSQVPKFFKWFECSAHFPKTRAFFSLNIVFRRTNGAGSRRMRSSVRLVVELTWRALDRRCRLRPTNDNGIVPGED